MKSFLTFFFFFTSIIVGLSQENKSTATSNVSIIEKEFLIPNLNSINHKIWVYLPPNYKTSSKKYPVIYMHDAQNVFDNATSYAGEWKVDETLNELYKITKKGFIVVAVENGGEERINEYTPWPHKKYAGGKGAIYIDFLKNTLKPFIDANYRTKKQAKHTAIIGSSLGGLISYYGGLKYPKTFGKIGALSTSFWFSNQVEDFTIKNGNNKTSKLYLLVGGKEGEDMTAATQKMKNLLLKTGFESKNIATKINPEGEHNEAFWSSEFLNIIQWLYTIK
ncbi:alpha/beta hydrolase [Lutibacter flavus]|uniref:Predicted hydrolase of the alpha/beta superfamily n=1 Tax=Lutibacter flavus TaxID=691689 RepID=A0A238X0U3_9FLAO|nr:alpha/beta hydrolase-fold protein [Lutibacter flavus]SNR52280.1 Predicted hydrolase of the alpha/beta superfamily [Lutibacter flavus]